MAFGSFQVSGVSSCDTFNENRRSDSSGQRIQRPGYTKRTAFDVQNPICKEQDPSDNDHFHEQTLYHMLKNEVSIIQPLSSTWAGSADRSVMNTERDVAERRADRPAT